MHNNGSLYSLGTTPINLEKLCKNLWGAYKDKDIFFFGTGFLIVLSFTDSEGGQLGFLVFALKGNGNMGPGLSLGQNKALIGI